MGFKLENKEEIKAAKTTDVDAVVSNKKSIKEDFKNGMVNLRFLAKKYDLTIKEVQNKLNK